MRLDLHKRTDLALRALHIICDANTRVPGPELADLLGTTRQYLPQVLNPLVKKRWVSSTPGPHGGYEPLCSLAEVSVLELIETMEGPTLDNRCVLTGRTCPQVEPCALHLAWYHARTALMNELDHLSLADVRVELVTSADAATFE
jgi:Rrf2 family iron-sulfur cluster assembly transcriptional regulator